MPRTETEGMTGKQREIPDCPVCGEPARINWIETTGPSGMWLQPHGLVGSLYCENDARQDHIDYWAENAKSAATP